MERATETFDRVARRLGIQAWNAGVVRLCDVIGQPQPVVHLLSSPETAAWNDHYRERRYARFDPLVDHGRGNNPPARVDDFPARTSTQRRIAQERREHGFRDGLIVPLWPLNEGGFVTVWGVPPDILGEPGGVAWQDLVGLCFYLGERGDFSGGAKLHARGERLSRREADVCRALLTGRSQAEAAEALRIRPATVGMHLDRARLRMRDLGMLPAWAGRSAVPPVAATLGLLP